jgi:hypothetical protein
MKQENTLSSQQKTDCRDAYWIAKALQTGMTPHPVTVALLFGPHGFHRVQLACPGGRIDAKDQARA